MKEYTVKVFKDGSRCWYLDGRRHREDGPAVEFSSGSKIWCLNGKRHREDGPAIEFSNGIKEWYLRGQRHREDGPAIEYADGTKEWWLCDKRHREDGPAIERADGTKQWWLNDKEVTEEEHKRRTSGITMDDALEETDRLRAKKKQIYEELQDAVEREWVAVVGNWGKVEWKEGIFPQLGAKLFVSPSEWVGLTDEEIEETFSFPFHYIPFARAIEAKLKEKNAVQRESE